MEEERRDNSGDGRILTFNLNSPWAWFYYSTFGIQLIIVSVIVIYRQIFVVDSDPITDTYLAILRGVSPHVPAMAAYSMVLAAIVEGVRMFADAVLEKRYRRGRRKGREEGREDARKEIAALVGQSPTIQAAFQKAIESGEIQPPPFLKDIDALNGNHRN